MKIKNLLSIVILCLILNTSLVLFGMEVVTEEAGARAEETESVSASHFVIHNRAAFKCAALDSDIRGVEIQTHSYEMSEREFKRAEREVTSGGVHINAWVSVGLAYRYGVPKIGVQKTSSEALKIMLTPAEIDRNISAIFHVAAMVADNEVRAYFPMVSEVLNVASALALRGNAPLLTVMLEIDQQTSGPVLNWHEYKSALRRIVATVPNARACMALARCTDIERFPVTVLGHYKKALELEPENVDAFLGAGVTVDNGHRSGIVFPEGTPSSLYYFEQVYVRDRLVGGNCYGSVLYEKASVSPDKKLAGKWFKEASNVLEGSVTHDHDALLSLADFHAVDHPAKPASFAKAFDHIKNYMQYSRRDEQRALEVIGNLRKAMQDLGHSKTKLFGKIVAYQNSLLPLESSEMDESA